jgi:protease-4
VAASQEIAEEIDKVKKSGKPVVASMGDIAASGGYWIASSCPYIVANPGTLTGSIGVIMDMTNIQGLYEKLGIKSNVIKSGSFKDIGSSTREMTPEERRVLEGMVTDSFQQFVAQVTNGRRGKIDEANIAMITDGRVFTGRQALTLGLVDKMGNFDDAIHIAQDKAGLRGEPVTEELNTANPLTSFISRFTSQSLLGQGLLKSRY